MRDARREAAWLSLVAVLLGTAIVPALHVAVHAVEAHEQHAPRPRPRPAIERGHASSHGHGHRHVGVGHHHAETPEPANPREPAPHHHQHHRHGDDGGAPAQLGRGSLEHLGVTLLPGATPFVPPPPRPCAQPDLAPAPDGIVHAPEHRPHVIRGPPA
jgi:hypothetical protein